MKKMEMGVSEKGRILSIHVTTSVLKRLDRIIRLVLTEFCAERSLCVYIALSFMDND